jgi:L-ribulose-5-phosphate 4-epimerase
VLYRRFDEVGGVVHTHSPAATAWAQARRDLPCLGTTHADHFRGAVPVTRALVSEEIRGSYEELTGEVIVETFAARGFDPLETPAALVASHGPFAWGADVERAVENAVALETVAGLALQTLALRADVSSLDDDLLERHFARKHGPGAYYGQRR